MEENQVELNAQRGDAAKDAFQTLIEGDAWTRCVPRAILAARKGVQRRLIVVVVVILGKNAQAELIEGRGGKGLQRLLHQRVVLRDKRIDGCAEGNIRCAVRKGKVRADGADDSVRLRGGRFADNFALRRDRAADLIAINAGILRQEAHDINAPPVAFPVIEALDRQGLLRAGEGGRQVDLRPRVRQGLSAEAQFKRFILFHVHVFFPSAFR